VAVGSGATVGEAFTQLPSNGDITVKAINRQLVRGILLPMALNLLKHFGSDLSSARA
jgi:hypothetical protein